jgi:kynureninase
MDVVRHKSLRQTALVRELCEMRGFEVTSPVADSERGGTVFVDFPGAREVSQLLVQRNILQDYRPGGGIRVSPHFYTTDDELHALVDEMDRARKAMTTTG